MLQLNYDRRERERGRDLREIIINAKNIRAGESMY